MDFIFTLFTGVAFLALPTIAGWLVWAFLLGLLVYALFRWRVYQPTWKQREWGFFIAFFILIALANLYIGLRLSSASTRPPPAATGASA